MMLEIHVTPISIHWNCLFSCLKSLCNTKTIATCWLTLRRKKKTFLTSTFNSFWRFLRGFFVYPFLYFFLFYSLFLLIEKNTFTSHLFVWWTPPESTIITMNISVYFWLLFSSFFFFFIIIYSCFAKPFPHPLCFLLTFLP